MHEAGIADRILDIVVARAQEAGAPRITAIHLEAGVLAGVSEDSLRFHWEQHAAGTPAEGAVLHFTEVDDADRPAPRGDRRGGRRGAAEEAEA